jgi:hypothetical protein
MRVGILKIISCVTAILGVLSACALDSESMIPTYVCGICVAWWTLFGYSNNWFRKSKYSRKRATQYKANNKVQSLSEYKKRRAM